MATFHQTAFAQAQRDIAAARASGAEALVLGDRPLDRLPDELGTLTSLRVLAVGGRNLFTRNGKLKWRPDGPDSGYRLTDISAVAPLNQLREISFCHCRKLSDISALRGLTQLRYLDFFACSDLTDLSAIADMKQLQKLDLCCCFALTDISPLATLSRLRILSISGCSKLTNISVIAGLKRLQHLELDSCDNLTDIAPLACLKQLRTLSLRNCKTVTHFAPLLPLPNQLRELYLRGSRFADLSPYFCREIAGNVLSEVRADCQDRMIAESENTEVKVVFLGNAGVGKTQLRRRLKDKPFQASLSTHGIEIDDTTLFINGRRVRLNLWDFGGQDIYYGTHALFMEGRAVFVLLWTPKHESGRYAEGDANIHHRPLSYWLDFIQAVAGIDNPVLVVQSHCDLVNDQCTPRLPILDFHLLRTLSCSSLTDFGLSEFKGFLELAVRYALGRNLPTPIGKGRLEVRDTLRRMPSNRKRAARRQTLSRQEFQLICNKTGKVSIADALLDYLHQSGVVFYRPELFQGRIIVDQNWALTAIYSLFDRKRTLPVLNRHGRFTRRELEMLIWQGYSVTEQEMFLSMMESCGICFRVRYLPRENGRHECEYLAPELLPEWAATQDSLLGRMQGGPDQASAELRYRFLHEGVLRTFLCRLGANAGAAAIYWKYGCWFFEDKSNCQVLIRSEFGIESGVGSIVLRAVGDRPQQVLDSVLAELLRIATREEPHVVRSYPRASADDHNPEDYDPMLAETGQDSKESKTSPGFDDLKIIATELREMRAIVERAYGRRNAFSDGLDPTRNNDAPDDTGLSEISYDVAANQQPGAPPMLKLGETACGLTDALIREWFDQGIPRKVLAHLQTFWCVGVLDKAALLRAEKALGLGSVADELLEMTLIPDLPQSPRHLGPMFQKLEDLFDEPPFSPAAWSYEERDRRLRAKDAGRNGKETHWTPRARKAWTLIDRLFALEPKHRPIMEPRKKMTDEAERP